MQTRLELVAGRRDWRLELERQHAQTSARLQAAYRRTLPALQSRIDALTARMAAAEDGSMSAARVRGLSEYIDLRERIAVEMRDFGIVTRTVAAEAQQAALPLGLDAAQDAVLTQAGGARSLVTGVWMRPDPAALEQLISYADGDAFRDKMAAFGENAATNFADVMLSLTTQGKNPRAIASAMKAWLGVPYSWAENTTRTMQLYSYRAATHAAYKANSRVVQGWVWRASLDARTCMSCIAQHGQRFTVDQTLNDHHRGRCAAIPIVIGTTWADGYEQGEAWFARQPEAVQRQMMGKGMHRAYQRGELNFRDLSSPYEDTVYGTMLRESSLRDMGLTRS